MAGQIALTREVNTRVVGATAAAGNDCGLFMQSTPGVGACARVKLVFFWRVCQPCLGHDSTYGHTVQYTVRTCTARTGKLHNLSTCHESGGPSSECSSTMQMLGQVAFCLALSSAVSVLFVQARGASAGWCGGKINRKRETK